MFTAALFTISKIWKQPKCLFIYEWIKILYIYTGILPIHKKEWSLPICNNLDGSRGYYGKWNVSDRERQIPCNFTYMWHLRNKKMEKKPKLKQTYKIREQTGGCQRGGRWRSWVKQVKRIKRYEILVIK